MQSRQQQRRRRILETISDNCSDN
ncbi:hypothetical protein BIW11_03656 [Tropilaelaps mercedesae]|uniref:Uncharacterized protein n=1 Tax=Tropilaelaps mercedesae TaxID=418985 RepID=A0A1V9XHQ3_9ACAR|nr:hypothetical protein BIW11_03656 [Tropilaelaps mercedesae]